MPTRPKGKESAAIERRDDAHIRTDGHSVVGRKWTTKVVRSPLTGERVWLLLEAGCSNSGGRLGQAQRITVFQRSYTAT